ncbi:MAG: phosphodiesterase [Paracoccaceae bacterium]
MKLIHLTDIHMVGGGQRLYGVDPARRLNLAVDSINAEHSDAAYVVVTGDLTNWADADAYGVVAQALGRLTPKVQLLIGNHDDRDNFARAFPTAPLDENGFVQSVFETPFGRALCLDTFEPGTAVGSYCEKRLNWLTTRLEEKDDPTLLFMHHPPFKIGLHMMDQLNLKDSDTFWDAIAPHAHRIRHLFFGHAHRAINGNWRGISYSCMRGIGQQLALDLEGSDPDIPGDLAEPAYGVILLSEDSVTVHLHEFANRSPRFALLTPDGMDPDRYALDMRHDGFDEP